MRTKAYLLSVLAVSAGLAGLAIACSDDAAEVTPTGTDAGGTPDSAVDPDGGGQQCPPAPAAGDCTTTKCTAKLGEPAACVENQCVKLKSLDCTEVFGDLQDNSILFATAFPLFGSNATSGKARRQAVQLAVDEINKKGVPTNDACDKPRPLAFLSCSDVSGVPLEDGGAPGADVLTQRLKDVGTHLSKDLKLPFVIGAGTSGNTTTLASVLLPAKTMLIAPSATAVAITTLDGATQDGTRLMWRTAPSDKNQGAALQALYGQVEAAVKATNGNTAVKVAIISKSDAYGAGIDGVLRAELKVNGKTVAAGITDGNVVADCYNISGGSTAACDVSKTTAAAQGIVTAAQPDIVILTGTAEAVTDIIIPHENSAAKKTIWLLPDGPRRPELTTYAKDHDELRGRVRGTIPGVVTPLAQDFYNFRYKAQFPNEQLIFGMAGAYDATYMFSYAMASLGKTAPTGILVAKAFEKLVGGTERVDVGPTKLTTGFNLMTSGGKMDFNGASGPLDFDFTVGEALSDINVWCVGKDPNTGTPFFNDSTGQTYDATGKALKGSFSCP